MRAGKLRSKNKNGVIDFTLFFYIKQIKDRHNI